MATLLTFLGRTLYQHRPFNEVDEQHIRRVSDGAPVAAAANPGLRVIPGFVALEEVDEVAACARDLLDRYGRSHLRPRDKAFFESQMSHLTKSERPFMNAERVTGRFERPDQPLAPWGHGDEFDVDALPEVLRKLAERARATINRSCDDQERTPLPALGPLRDVTINRRRDGYFRLDPHLDPAPWYRGHLDGLEVVELAVMRDQSALHQAGDHLEHLVRAPASPLEGVAGELELLAHPTNADTNRHPALREDVDRCQRFRCR